MFVVLVAGQPQAYDGRSLSSCSRGACLFSSYADADKAATTTLEIAKNEYPQWGILQYGYKIVKLVTEPCEAESIGLDQWPELSEEELEWVRCRNIALGG